ncbi:GSCOCG00013487001-RA-CDS [Cotesia congregata]|nr:GSCOCG00013487001-RA-CDS [Cotesia congregata]
MTFFVSSFLSTVFELLDETDSRVLYNYAGWKVLQHAIPYLTKDYQDLRREYCKTQECGGSLRDKCLKVVLKYLQPAVDLLYAKRYFTEEADSLVSAMVENIKRQTKDLISKSSWMDQDTKKEHIDAIDNIPVIIGYAEKNSTDDEFVKYYEELEIDTSNFFQTLMNLEAFDSPRRFYSTNGLGPRNFINPLLATADFSAGKLYVPMNMLREPFFSVDYPMSVNYGFSGRAIAKALARGILHRREPRSQAMKDKVACFSKQVANYTSQLPFETNLLIDEYLGFKISYHAYQSWLSSISGGREPMIPELPYSDRQIFWMSSLQKDCKRPWNKYKTIEDKYFPFEFRKMIDLSNVPEFYDDFNCQSQPFLETHGPSCTLF